MASSNLAVINEQSKATPDNTRGWLTQRSKTMEALVPHGTGVKIDRMIVQATALCANNPTLAACTVRSIQLAVFKAAELGLELLPELAQAYIVPRSGQATFQIGYKGWRELAYRSGVVRVVQAFAVYDGDYFEVEYGTNARIVHRPAMGPARGDPIGYYAVADMTNGARPFVFMDSRQLDEWAKKYRGQKSFMTEDAWRRKTVVKRLCLDLPQTPALRSALAMDMDDDQPVPVENTARPDAISSINAEIVAEARVVEPEPQDEGDQGGDHEGEGDASESSAEPMRPMFGTGDHRAEPPPSHPDLRPRKR